MATEVESSARTGARWIVRIVGGAVTVDVARHTASSKVIAVGSVAR